METKKSKVFTRKLISLVLSLVMAVSGFFGVAMSAQAYQKGGYNDTNVGHNALAWVDATDDQTLEALLDYADDFLANMDWDGLNETLSKVDIESAVASYSAFIGLSLTIDRLPYVKVHAETKGAAKVVASVNVNIEGYADSVDGIIKILFNLADAVQNDIKPNASKLKSFIDLTTIANLNFDVFGNYFHNENRAGTAGYRDSNASFRGNNSAKFILKGLLKWLLVDNYNNGKSSSVIHDVLYGSADILPGMLDLYGMLEGTLGLEDWEKDSDGKTTYQINNGIVYNLLKSLIVKNVPIYTASEHLKDEGSNWVYDTEAYKIANYYLGKLSFNITYVNRVDYTGSGLKDENGEAIEGYHEDSSVRRYAQAKAAGELDENGQINASYATAQGWDSKLVYSTEEGYEGNVLVAQYDGNTVTVNNTDTIHSVVMKALPTVWKTALKPTIELLHVNYNGHDVHGTNFDNAFYYWVSDNGGWNRTNWTANYTEAKVNAWAAAVYADYGFEDAASFVDYVKETLVYNKTRLAKNDKYNWRDIEVSYLFNEIRYSPLADKYFEVQTGPLNLYFSQTGCSAIETFFDGITSSDTVIGKIDDALVAAMADLFPVSNYVGKTTYDDATGEYGVTSTSLPALATDSTGTVSGVVSTLINDAGKVFKYAADATDANILNPYYAIYGEQDITEDNLETAIIPFAIAALKQWNLTASVHDSDWDKVCDIESAAVVALSEYLKFVYPERDYSGYYDLQEQNVVVNGETVAKYKYIVAKDDESLLENVIVPMAGDAIAFVLDAAGVPVYVQDSNSTCKTEVNGATVLDPHNYTFFGKGVGLNNMIWQTLNSVVCYFAVDKGIAGLANLQGAVSKSNTIWQNIDNVINPYLPVLTQIMPLAVEGSTISSQKLIWNQLVEGVADVKTNKFLTTTLSYIGNLITSAPISTTTVLNAAIFDIVKPLVNKLLGSRTGTADIITQTASTTNPVDNFLKRDYLINTAINNLIANLYGVLTTTAAVGTSTYTALGFGLGALHIVPKIDDNRIGGVSATLNEHAVTDTNVRVKMGVRNESWGYASFYKDANGDIHQRGRSNANILGYQIYKNGTQTSELSVSADTGYSTTGNLPAEDYKRVIVSGTATANTLYTIVVNYTMTTYDTLGSSEPTKTYTAKAVDYLYVGNIVNDDWKSAYSGSHISSTVNEALVSSDTSGNLTITSPNYIGVGTNASGANYTYHISNTGGETTVKNSYAYVSENTPDYYDYEGKISTAADSGSVYVAVDKAGQILKADGTTVDAKAYIASEPEEFMGYISHDNGETITAVTVDSGSISDFVLGTPLAGVYLDDESVTVDAQTSTTNDDKTVYTPGEADVRIFSEDSQGGLSTDYAPMTVRMSNGYAFNMIASSGDIDGPYAAYKSDAKGLAIHYDTSTDSTQANAMKSTLSAALQSTIADGINATNVAQNIDVADLDEDLLAAAIKNRTIEVDDVMFYVVDARKNRSNVNYKSAALYEKAVDMAQEAENLLVKKAQLVDAVDDSGNPIKKEKRDANGDVVYDYYSFAPSIKLQEAARLFADLYDPQAVLQTYSDTTTGKVATEEVTHATSPADEYDVTIPATANTYSDFTATKVADSTHVFPYSTADEEMKEYDTVDSYDVYAKSANEVVKFGAIDTADNNKLVNTGSTVYSEASWNAYVDALGETIAAINNHATISELYDARSHLVMAENNLEEGEAGEGITIKGTVYIAQNLTATAEDQNFGARAINFKVNGEYVLDENGDNAVTSSEADHYGEFEITVPEGTTELTVTGPTTIDRTVTLSGTQDIDNAQIFVVIGDFEGGDGNINVSDFTAFKAHNNSKAGDAKYDVSYNYNDDDNINVSDFTMFKTFNNKVKASTFSYTDQALD